MIVVQYIPAVHKQQLEEILVRRKMQTTMSDNFPTYGFVAVETSTIAGINFLRPKVIAAGFVRRVEGGYTMLDSFITDPAYPSATRNEALEKVSNMLIALIRRNSAAKMICLTMDDGIADRAEKGGFVKTPHLVMVKEDR